MEFKQAQKNNTAMKTDMNHENHSVARTALIPLSSLQTSVAAQLRPKIEPYNFARLETIQKKSPTNSTIIQMMRDVSYKQISTLEALNALNIHDEEGEVIALTAVDFAPLALVDIDRGIDRSELQLIDYGVTKIQEVALCLDNDAAGLEATKRLTEALKQAEYENVSCLLPEYKDWNEQLKVLCQDEPEPEMAMSM